MSQENVELWRENLEAFRPGTGEFDPEVMISKMAELWNSDKSHSTPAHSA